MEKGSSVQKTVFTILKSFVGSGILFLPKGFENGGMLFSIVVLGISAFFSIVCMLRLTDCTNAIRHVRGVSYGMIGKKAFGKGGKIAVNVSLVLSQLGFCCSYLIFIEKNLRDVIMHFTDCKLIPGPWLMIALQVVFLIFITLICNRIDSNLYANVVGSKNQVFCHDQFTS